jgi:hypothetical protein
MNPNDNNQPINLPEPIADESHQPSYTPPALDAPAPPISQQHISTSQTLSTVDNENALIADDVDLIEKEWVLKAKAIVAQTIHDPNQQAIEMEKVKAEYLSKRYNKQVKTAGS